ncbi:MAG: protein kinase [Planctomycetales bacterium]|nr:protein kinase [Planctomycetales bacterium]
MVLICSYCGSECNERDQANGRCGSCACFFNGNEEVVAAAPEKALPDDTPEQAPKAKKPAQRPQSIGESNHPSPPSDPPPSGFDPTAIEPFHSAPTPANSEGLIQPRRLSPQFRRRVEMTWQSTFGGGGHTAEHTLSSKTPSSATKVESPTLSIATRRISKGKGTDGSTTSGDYELNEVIGEGSMGRVWSARQTSLDRNVAVKVPMAELTGAGSVGESQFISEVVVTGKLEHPNIVPIYELGRDSTGVPFYSMKHVQGRPWNELIGDKTDQENLEILMKVCDAIAFAHDRNFLHRDIKPHNVMVGEFGEVSVMDWGIAVSITKDPDQPWASVATGPAGTPAYMAPEMAAHNPSELGVVSDIYLLGAVLYEIVTGTPPHPRTGDTGEALLAAAANEIIPTTKTGELVDIARRAMATNLVDRYQSVQELQDAIREYQSHRESIKLSESADEHFAQAVVDKSSDEFARARFAYEEALRLWDGNTGAASGMRTATLAHAKNALDQENYELGISILDPHNPEHRDLLSNLETKRAARRRLAWFSKIAAATALLAVLSVVGVTFYSYDQLKESAESLKAEKETAVEQTTIAVKAAKEAHDAEIKALDSESKAKNSERVAIAAKDEARIAESTARLEKRRAEEAAYASEIGLAAESIGRNDFDKATRILNKLDPASGPDANPVMSKLRHIEWGLLRDSASPATVDNLLSQYRIETVGSSVDGTVLAAGTEKGNVYLWRISNPNDPLPEPVTFQFGDQVTALAVSDDGRFLAVTGTRIAEPSGSGANSVPVVKIWNAGDSEFKQPLATLSGHAAEVLSIAFSKDGERLVTSAADRTAVVWDRSTGQRLSTMRDHLDRQVWSASFSPDGRMVVTTCEDGRVRVWDISGGGVEAKKKYDFRGHDGPVYAAVFTNDGQSVISGGYDRRLLRWKMRSSSSDATAIATAGTSKLAARLEGNPIDEMTMELVGQDGQQHEASIRSIAVASVGEYECVLSGGNDNTIRVWSRAENKWTLNKILRGHGRWVRSNVFTRNGQSVLSGAYDGLKLWRWQDYLMPNELFPIAERRLGRQPSELGLSAASKTIYSPDGRWIATAYDNGTVAVWDLKSGDRAASQLLGDGHALLTATGQFFDGGTRLLTSAGDNTTRLWDVKHGTQTQKLSGTGYRGVAAAMSQPVDSKMIVVTGSDDRMTPAWLWIVQTDSEPTKIPLLADYAGEHLARLLGNPAPDSDQSPQIEISNLSDRQFDQVRKLKRRIPDVTTVAFSPDGRQFMVGDSLGQCFLFEVDAETSRPVELHRFRAHGSSLSSAAFLPTGRSLITASSDGQIRQWSTDTAEMVTELPWSGPVTALTVDDDGRYLLVGYAPVERRNFPVAQRFIIDGNRIESNVNLSNRDNINSRNWDGNQPTVQSVQFTRGGDQALVTLFFPTTKSGGNRNDSDQNRWTGYRMGFWNFNDPDADFQVIPSSRNGEISSAIYGKDPSGSQLLVVGGKGARLWASDDRTHTSFQRLTKSFRPASSIASLDFAMDLENGNSNRLVVGDAEGNLRVWQLDANQWSENSVGAEHLAGRHDAPIVSTFFHPLNPDQMISADQAGNWIIWQYDSSNNQWKPNQEFVSPQSEMENHFAMFSPDGRFVLSGSDDQARIWQRNDQGVYERNLEDWQPGKVQSATFAADGSWIITSDGDRSVCFWDSIGNRIAKMDEDDAKEMTTMAISHDRRRFVTGQGKRIVIWDTSRIIEPQLDAADDRPASVQSSDNKLIAELLTLEEHRAVTSISISPDGCNLLSSGTEGRTIIWTGEPVAPISISLSTNQISYRTDLGAVHLDRGAALVDPSKLADFSQAELSVLIADVPRQTDESSLDSGSLLTAVPVEHATLVPVPDRGGALIEVNDEAGEKVIRYRSHQQASWVSIGQLASSPEGDSRLIRIRFNDNATAAAVQSVLRTLSYRIVPSPKTQPIASKSADVAAEQVPVTSRLATIVISGLTYDKKSHQRASTDSSDRGDLYPEKIEAQVTIEIDTNEDADQPDSDDQFTPPAEIATPQNKSAGGIARQWMPTQR